MSEPFPVGRGASDAFENHCRRDPIPAALSEVCSHYGRDLLVGPAPALLADGHLGGRSSVSVPYSCEIGDEPACEMFHRIPEEFPGRSAASPTCSTGKVTSPPDHGDRAVPPT
jgi:hypothetical protein